MEPSDKDAQAPSLEVALLRESILRGLSRKIWSGGKKWSGRTNFGRPKLVRPCQNWSYCICARMKLRLVIAAVLQSRQLCMDSSDVGDLTAEVYQYLTEGKQKLIVRYLS